MRPLFLESKETLHIIFTNIHDCDNVCKIKLPEYSRGNFILGKGLLVIF